MPSLNRDRVAMPQDLAPRRSCKAILLGSGRCRQSSLEDFSATVLLSTAGTQPHACTVRISKHAHHATHQPSRQLPIRRHFLQTANRSHSSGTEKTGEGAIFTCSWSAAKSRCGLPYTTTGSVCCADWSPDGQQIVFGRLNDSGGAMFTVPALGGTERKITDVTSLKGARWTADGKSLVLTDSCTPDAPQGIMVFSLQTGEKRCLHSPPPEEEGDAAPILSPDQKTVAFARMTTLGMWQMYTVAFSGGNLRKLTHETFTSLCQPLMWSPDGKYVVFEPQPGRMARVAASGGPVEFEAVYPKIGSLSRDGRRLAYLEPSPTWTNSTVLWRMDLSSAGGKVVSQTRILASLSTNDSAQLSPDEKHLVFHSARFNKRQIWKSNADGTDPLQLISFDTGFPGTPRWSPDGKWVAFDYRATAHGQIHVIDSEGRNFRALTSGKYENLVPSWSRDGKVVYFASNRTGRWQVWKRELSTGSETQVTRHGGFAAFESYDARALYYSKYKGGGLWTIPVGGGQEVRIADDLHLGSWGNFAVTERGLYFVDSEAKGGAALLYYNFQTRSLSSVVTLKDPPGHFLAESRSFTRR